MCFKTVPQRTWTSSSAHWVQFQNRRHASVYAKLLQLCLTLCNSVDCSQPGSSVHGTLQVRIVDWIDMPSSRGFSRPRKWTHISCTGRHFTTGATWEAPWKTWLTVYSFQMLFYSYMCICEGCPSLSFTLGLISPSISYDHQHLEMNSVFCAY